MTVHLDRPAAPRLISPGVQTNPSASRAIAKLAPLAALLIVVNLAAITSFLLSYSRHGVGFAPFRIDLDVYRIGGRLWLRHGDLYGVLPPTSNGVRLPFTYPPIAAVLFSPLSLVPMAVAGTVLSLATVALTALVLRLFLRSAAGPGAGPGADSWWTIGWLLPVALLLEPMRHTLGYGQVNVALMALVSADCLPATVRWPRGLLVGVAAAVKLTPAAFVLFFACRGDRRAVATSAVTFAVCEAAGFPLAWHDSVRYWTSVMFQTGRPGSTANAANQSIQAVLVRAGLDPHAPAEMAAWLALSAVVLVLAWYGMRRAVARSADAWALSLNAFAALLICPISWSHHWVWAGPALLVLAIRGLRDRRRGMLAGAAAGLAVFVAAPQWWFPTGGDREIHWPAWQQVIGSSYVFLAAVILLLSIGNPLGTHWPPWRRPAAMGDRCYDQRADGDAVMAGRDHGGGRWALREGGA
ncbi:MAG TPA: glycosyltransferase 87 family protein [Streptosporangiaceae bacterium]